MMKFWEDWKEKLKKFLKAMCWHFTCYGENRQTITMNICVFYMQHCF